MKKNSLSLLIYICVICSMQAYAQVLNYQKLKAPAVDGGGRVFDAEKNTIGRIDKDGVIYDAGGAKVAHFDPFRNVLENATEENFGKSDNEGNHLIVVGKKVISWKSNHPENAGLAICLIKDKNGAIVGTVNKVYKEYGTGALYYLVSKYVKTVVSNEVQVKSETAKKSIAKASKKKIVPAKKKTTVKKTVTKKTNK